MVYIQAHFASSNKNIVISYNKHKEHSHTINELPCGTSWQNKERVVNKDNK